MTVPTLLLPKVAAVLEADGHSELADELLAHHRGEKIGEETPTNIALANLWCHLRERVEVNGEDLGEVLAQEAEANQISYDSISDLWGLQGRPAVRRILKEWNQI
jgi:hypothetical protein